MKQKSRHCRRTTVEHDPHEWYHPNISGLSGSVAAAGYYARHRRDVKFWCTGKAEAKKP